MILESQQDQQPFLYVDWEEAAARVEVTELLACRGPLPHIFPEGSQVEAGEIARACSSHARLPGPC